MEDSSQIPVARRAVLEAGRQLDLDPEIIAKAEIVAVELAHNILQHGRTVTSNSGIPTRRIRRPGEIFISSTLDATALQILAVDSGPGIPSIARALQDGFSTSTTPGHGLGAVRRLSREFDIFSAREPEGSCGTVVTAIVGPPLQGPGPTWNSSIAALSSAIPGETVNGDSWATVQAGDRSFILLVDGLGHGLYASEAANLAVELFLRFTRSRPLGEVISPAALLEQMHPLLRATRGAAIALLRLDPATRLITFCGIGNISAAVIAPNGHSRSMVSRNGTIGHQMPRAQEFTHIYTAGSLLILHSDGITTSWKLQATPGLDRQASATIAGAIYRDAWRGRDDATLMVARLA